MTVPAPPTMDVYPTVNECSLKDGQRGQCVTFWGADYLKLQDYMDALVIEIERACIEIGQVALPVGWDKAEWLKAIAAKRVSSACHADQGATK